MFVACAGCDWSLKLYRLHLSTAVKFEAHCLFDGGAGPREIPATHNSYVFIIEFPFDNPSKSQKHIHDVLQLSANMCGIA